MSKAFHRFYWVNGTIFENSDNKVNAKGKAIRYCKENDIKQSEIYELSNESELAYLKILINRTDVSSIKSHEKVQLIGGFLNSNNDMIQPFNFETSFFYLENKGDQKISHFVSIIESVYDLNKAFLVAKTLFDLNNKNQQIYLEVYYLDNGEWKEWKMGDSTLAQKDQKEQYKKMLTQKKAIRDRQKYDRLLKLRQEGKASERQLQELYRLQNVFGG